MVAACLLLGVLACLATSCRTSRYLDDDEYIIKRNRVSLAQGAEVENWRTLQAELQQQIVTPTNGNFLFVIPREWYYLRGRARGKDTRYRGFVQRIIAEPPALLDTVKLEQSRRRIRTFMLNRGYFDAEVDVRIDTTEQHGVRLAFEVQPGGAYRYRDIEERTANPVIAALLESTQAERVLQPGGRVDSRDYDREVARIVSLLRNNGFAYFYANSVSPLDADSTGQLVDATLEVLPPAPDEVHETFRVGRVTVFPDNDPLSTSTTVAVDTSYDGLRFIYSDEEMRVDVSTLADNIFIRPGETFDQSQITKTNLQLNGLGIFRSVALQQERSDDSEREIDFYIQLSQNELWEIGGDVEVSFTDRQTVDRTRLSLIGGQVSGSIGNRNLRGGGERLSFGLNAGLEFNFAELGNEDIQRLNTIEFGATTSYALPRFVDYFGLYRGLNRVKSGEDESGAPQHFVSDAFYTALRERATTQLVGAANYVSLLNFYETITLRGTFGYRVDTRPTDRYTINHIGVEYFRLLNPGQRFLDILDAAPFLANSLGDQVFTAFLFRDIGFQRVAPARRSAATWTILGGFEQSGFELFLANKFSNAIDDSDDVFQLSNGLDYARYVRATGSVAVSYPIGQRQSLAFRGQIGTALTYGYQRRQRDVPYVRQFFGGGNASLRGWNARGVGPGSYRDSLTRSNANVANYQQANFKLELNAEYRGFLTNIFTTKLEGAVFVDAGNIWTFRQEPERPGSQFRFDKLVGDDGAVVNEPFYQQIAINTGVGARLDVGYVLIRVDMGVKLRNPYRIDGSYFPRSFAGDGQSRINYAIGLNYPF